MRDNDRLTDRESDSHSRWLRRKERLEDLLLVLLIDSRTGVLDGNADFRGALVEIRRNPQPAFAIGYRPHRFDRVPDHVQENLLQLPPIAHDLRERRRQRGRDQDALGAQIERLIETSGRQWTFLRPGMFAANARSWWAPRIRAGGDVVRWPYSAAPTAPIHERDIAAVAVRALCEDGHAGAEYVLTGPQSLSQFEQISTIGGAIGRSLRMEEISPEDARHELLTVIPAVAVNMLLAAWAAAIGQPALVTSTVAEITGAPARTFRDWAADHAAEFRA